MARETARNPYEVLALKSDCSQAEIKAAFRRRALETHPDKVPTAAPGTAGVGQFAEVLAAYTLLKDERARRTWDEEQARPGVKMRIPKQYPGMARSHSAQSTGATTASEHTQHSRQGKDERPGTAAELDAQTRLRASAAKAGAMRAKMEAAVADQQLLAAEAARARVKERAAAEERALMLDAKRARERAQEKAHAYGFASPIQHHRNGGLPTPHATRQPFPASPISHRPAAPRPAGSAAQSPASRGSAPAGIQAYARAPSPAAPNQRLPAMGLNPRSMSETHPPRRFEGGAHARSELSHSSSGSLPWSANETARMAAAELESNEPTWALPPQRRWASPPRPHVQRPSAGTTQRSNSIGGQWAEVTGVAAMAEEERMERCTICGRTIEVHTSHVQDLATPSSCLRCQHALEESKASASTAAVSPLERKRSNTQPIPSTSSASASREDAHPRQEVRSNGRGNSHAEAHDWYSTGEWAHCPDDPFTETSMRQNSEPVLQRVSSTSARALGRSRSDTEEASNLGNLFRSGNRGAPEYNHPTGHQHRVNSTSVTAPAERDRPDQRTSLDAEEDSANMAFAGRYQNTHGRAASFGGSLASAASNSSYLSEPTPSESAGYYEQFISSVGYGPPVSATSKATITERDSLSRHGSQREIGRKRIASPWEPEAELLRDMGFDDPRSVQLALNCANGNIAEALELLV